MKVFCFTCGNDEARVVATKGEHNLVECTKCGCRWRRSLDPLYERTALVEVDVGEQIATTTVPLRDDNNRAVVRLIDAPAGLFRYCGYLGFKTEYMTDGGVEAYVVASGERFWAGVETPKQVNDLLVTPVDPYNLRPRGRWNEKDFGLAYSCSECRYTTGFNLSNFCPQCGAGMRKV